MLNIKIIEIKTGITILEFIYDSKVDVFKPEFIALKMFQVFTKLWKPSDTLALVLWSILETKEEKDILINSFLKIFKLEITDTDNIKSVSDLFNNPL